MRKHLRLRYLILIGVTVLILGLAGYSWFALSRPFATVKTTPVYAASALNSQTPALAWPSYGQTAFSLNDGAVQLSQGSTQPQPTASVAKIMTALSVLDKQPLSGDQTGPTLTLTAADVAIYNSYVAKDGSVAYVKAGEQISERQALTTMLLPSANNMADTLAIWAFGSMDNYVQYANQKAATLGLTNSHFADASGFSPATTSTAVDLVKLGETALKNSVLADIVSQRLASVPVASTIYNTNYLLGHNGIFGLKTGNTDQAGGCYLFAAHVTAAGTDQTVTVVGAIMGAPNLNATIDDSVPLLNSIGASLSQTEIIKAGDAVAKYTAPWGQTLTATASSTVSLLRWNGETLQPKLSLQTIDASTDASGKIGQISATNGFGSSQTDVVLNGRFSKPSVWWRLLHPANK